MPAAASTTTTDARFLLRPRWLLSHVFVLALVIVMVNLGFWQLRRLDERRERNDVIELAMDAEPVEVTTLLRPGDPADAAEAVRFRRVQASGSFAPEGEVLVRNRSFNGVSGVWVVTPLVLDTGGTVLVNRGFVASGDGAAGAAVAGGPVTVEGILIAADRLDRTTRIDLGDPLDDPDVLAAVLQIVPGDANADTSPLPVPAPELGEGPHLGYAAQWFIFSTIAVVGYPLVLRRLARQPSVA